MITDAEKKLEQCNDAGHWGKAEQLCRREIANEPDNSHWWYIHLGMALIERKRYDDAAAALEKADEGKGYCPLVNWYKGVLQYELKNWQDALAIFRDLHNRSTRLLNSSQWIPSCWESVKRTEELDNDCRGRIGFCYFHLGDKKKAAWWWKQHLLNRKRGRFSIYDARVVKRYLREIEEEE